MQLLKNLYKMTDCSLIAMFVLEVKLPRIQQSTWATMGYVLSRVSACCSFCFSLHLESIIYE